jgi:type IV secretory pathway VirB10-like protein
MTNVHQQHRNLIRVTFAAIFTTAIAAIWLACAISGFVAVQKTAECDRSPDQNPPSQVLPEPAQPRPTKTPKPKTAKPKNVPPSPPWTTRRKNDVM